MPNLNQAVDLGLQSLILTPEQRQAFEDALVANARGDIMRRAQGESESLFGRGLGISSLQEGIERTRSEALAKARRDAAIAANQMQTTGVTTAANQLNAEADRAARERMHGANVAQTAADRKARMADAKSNRLFQGMAGLAGGGAHLLGRVAGPALEKSFSQWWNKDKAPGGTPPFVPAEEASSMVPPNMSMAGAAPAAAAAAAAPALGNFDFGLGDTASWAPSPQWSGGLSDLSNIGSGIWDNLGSGFNSAIGGLSDFWNNLSSGWGW